MNLVFYETAREQLLPLTWTRPVADIRVGVLTIREKWQLYLGVTGSADDTVDFLRTAQNTVTGDDHFYINGNICPTAELAAEVKQLKKGEALFCGEDCVAIRSDSSKNSGSPVQSSVRPSVIRRPYDIFRLNDAELKNDFALLTRGRNSAPLSASNTVIGNGQVFLEEGAKVEASVLNASAGPIYIGRDAEVMEGCLIRGPFALGAHAVLKMGAKIYGATTIGPGCKVGGEVNNSVFFANSNKAHDGFIGNAVIGEWCNLGADTNCSNLKNTYGEVEVYNYASRRNENSGLQFCGLIMGDHAKCGINTMFNTGTVVGVCANVFGSDFPPKFIPDFSWGGADGMMAYRIDKALQTIARVWERRQKKMEKEDQKLLTAVFARTSEYRHPKQ